MNVPIKENLQFISEDPIDPEGSPEREKIFIYKFYYPGKVATVLVYYFIYKIKNGRFVFIGTTADEILKRVTLWHLKKRF